MNKFTTKILIWVSLLGTICLMVLAILPLLNNTIYFFTDVSRDFLILDEIKNGKFTLIGPRTSAIPGVFHGPLWAYLNLPAYVISHGNPIGVGWFWFILTIIYLILSWFLVRKYLSSTSAWVFVALSSVFLSLEVKTLYNPHGAFFVTPFFFFFLMDYLKNQKVFSLALSVFFLGCIIQFQMAIGGPILVITLPLVLKRIFQTKQWKHLFTWFVILIPLSSFILFDLRHNFFQIKTVSDYIFRQKVEGARNPYFSRISQRLYTLSEGGIGIFREQFQSLNIFTFAVVSFVLGTLVSKKSYKNSLFFVGYALYFYLGYFIVSVFFNGSLLGHHWFPIISFSFILISALIKSSENVYLSGLVCLAVGLGIVSSYSKTTSYVSLKGTIEDDWAFQRRIAEIVFNDAPSEFGYYVFAPDIFAYESKAAMVYGENTYPNKQAYRLQKKPVTYLIIAPPPKDQPYFNEIYWKQSRVNINRDPDYVFTLPAEYRIEKYNFTEAELSVPSDSSLDWMLFR